MEPITNRVKVWTHFWGLTIEVKNFVFVIKVLVGLESTRLGCQVAEIGLNDPHD